MTTEKERDDRDLGAALHPHDVAVAWKAAKESGQEKVLWAASLRLLYPAAH